MHRTVLFDTKLFFVSTSLLAALIDAGTYFTAGALNEMQFCKMKSSLKLKTMIFHVDEH